MITKFKIFENLKEITPKDIFNQINKNEKRIPYRNTPKAKNKEADWLLLNDSFECSLFNSTLFRFYFKYIKNNNIIIRTIPIPDWVDHTPFDIVVGYYKRFNEYINSYQFTMEHDQERRIFDLSILDKLDKISDHLIFETYFNDSIVNESKILNYIKSNWKNINTIPETEKEHYIRNIFKDLDRSENQVNNVLNGSGAYLETIKTLKNYANN